jgi:hypothetical protein
MNKGIKGYSKVRNKVFLSKIEEQKKFEELLKQKYKQLKNDTATKR